ncbi:MAG: DUF1236 domain-containing protein [Shinella sp.]|nr:DUF1236 domain-containing protein [Shinella sp.]
MRKLLMAGAALALIGGSAAYADDQGKELFGGATGGATGAAAGAIVGGPIGAVVGGVAGAAIGASSAVPEDARVYVMENPVNSVAIEGELAPEYHVSEGVALTPIPDHPDLAYVYVDDRPVIVRTDSREVVYVPEVAMDEPTATMSMDVPETTITYIERNPVDPIMLEGEVSPGVMIPEDVDIMEVPENPSYGYVYVDERPVLVDRGTRQVIWVR